ETEVAIAALKNRITMLKRVVEGNSVYIIYKGRLRQRVLLENRISINELLTEMRIQGYADIADIEYGILEQNGKISLFDKSASLAHPIVIDGEVNENALTELGYSMSWLNKQLARENARLSDIFLLEVLDDGEVKLVRRENIK
ncbi:MAG: DUF421 domain-containing protein, partial [Clostridia bacterium]|nr:DUF421 domain-containing protein [Clostridia bacterium]